MPPVVVAIGSSAGGVEALSRLIPHLPRSGFAYVILQHLPHEQAARFTADVASQCPHPTVQVDDGSPLLDGHVHIVPPQSLFSLNGNEFARSARAQPPDPILPIDYFLASLAQSEVGPGIAVLLSGVRSDGIAGLREVRAAGGFILVQDPATARYENLPQAAIHAGLADRVLAPEAIARELPVLARRLGDRSLLPRRPGDEIPVDDDQLERVFAILKTSADVDFSSYKRGTVRRRLQRRMVLNRIEDLPRYLRLLEESPEEVRELFQDLLIHVTRFFRDPSSFQALKEVVFPTLLADRRVDDPIRFWVPGCSTGEEAYSLAIVLLEFLGERASSLPIQIFATDLSDSAIAVARAALYRPAVAEQVGSERLARFFTAQEGGYRVSKPVRDLCVFTRHDLTRDPPFSRLDLVMCRNVLIYLGSALQKRVIAVLHYGLKPDGYLALGSAESIGGRADLFRVVQKRFSIYAKKGGVFALPPSLPREYAGTSPGHRALPRSPAGHAEAESERVLLDRYAPPGVLVDADFNIVQSRGQTGPFLELAPGEASLNILRMAREGLVYSLRTALHQAQQTDKPVSKTGVQVTSDGRKSLRLEVVPVGAQGNRHYLVLFESPPDAEQSEPGAEADAAAEAAEDESDKSEEQRLRELQEELSGTRNYLQTMIQDLEAANEELQSANEEILSSNEELQSTNEELDTAREELQSTNEELHTLNEELQARNEDLGRANSDLTNLLGSVNMAVVMVDKDLRIRRFTPMAERVLNLIQGDLGRPIGHIKPNLDLEDLEGLIRGVITDSAPVERECRTGDGSRFLLRIRTYKDLENRIDGAVLSLLNVEELRARQGELVQARRLADDMLQADRTPAALLGPGTQFRAANRPFHRLFGVSPEELNDQPLARVSDGNADFAELRTLLRRSGRRRGSGAEGSVVLEHDFPHAGTRVVELQRLEADDEGELLLLKIREPGAARGED